MTLIAFLVVVAVIAMLWKPRRPKANPAPAGPVSPESDLLRHCHGDTAKMERLIALEWKAAPSIARSEASGRAIDRLRRDHR